MKIISFFKNKKIKLKGKAWTDRKREVFVRDVYRCQLCGGGVNTETAHPHHIVYKSQGGDDSLNNLITLCFNCHRQVHDLAIKLNGVPISKAVIEKYFLKKIKQGE